MVFNIISVSYCYRYRYRYLVQVSPFYNIKLVAVKYK